MSEFFVKSLHVILESRIPFVAAQSQSGGAGGGGGGGGGRGGDEVSFLGSSPVSSSSSSRSTNRWFNLELENCNAVQESAEPWRRGIMQEAMVVDILLQQQQQQQQQGGDPLLPSASSSSAAGGSSATRHRFFKGASSPNRYPSTSRGGDSWSGNDDSFSSQGGPSPTLLERWVVHYERRKKPPSTATGGLGLGGTGRGVSGGGGGGGLGHSESWGSGNLEGRFAVGSGSPGRAQQGVNLPIPYLPTHVIESPVVYKRTIIMLRSLYCSVRTLPAHRLFRLANSSSHSQSFSLSYMVSAAPPPLTTGDDRLMSTCRLTPIETQWGRLCVSVAYRSATAVTALEIMPPILPRIIADYVGSPTTDPLRRFSSIGSMPSRGNPGKQGVHMVSLPSSVPVSLGRRHSWSGGLNKVAGPPSLPPSSPTFQSASPSPNFHPSPPKPPSSPSGQGHMPSHLSPRTSPLHRPFSQPSSYQGHSNASQPIPIKSRYSPPFSPSPSPSPPAHGYSQQDNVLRSSSAPVSIPRPSNPMRPNSRHPMADPYHQNRGLLPPPSPQSKPAEVMLNRVASCNPRLWHGAQVHNNLHFNSNTFLSLPILRDCFASHIRFTLIPLSSGETCIHVHFFKVNSKVEPCWVMTPIRLLNQPIKVNDVLFATHCIVRDTLPDP